MHYHIGTHRVVFMVGTSFILKSNIHTCRDCKCKFVIDTLQDGVKSLYGFAIANILRSHNIQLCSTTKRCTDCQLTYLNQQVWVKEIFGC